jgi:hypothetical protein
LVRYGQFNLPYALLYEYPVFKRVGVTRTNKPLTKKILGIALGELRSGRDHRVPDRVNPRLDFGAEMLVENGIAQNLSRLDEDFLEDVVEIEG